MISFWKDTLGAKLNFAVTVFFAVTNVIAGNVSADCSLERWQLSDTRPYIGLAYPEANARYWVFSFTNNAEDHLRLTLSAQFPYARYIAYTLYSLDDDESEGYPVVYNGDIQHLEDVKIQPLDGHGNPYLDGASRDVEDRSYELHIVQEGEESEWILPDGTPKANTLVIPAGKRALALYLRVYLPDDPDDFQGGVDLPTVTAVNEQTGQQIPCPEEAQDSLTADDIFVSGQYDPNALSLPDDAIYTYRPGNYPLFSNGDCPYLVAPLIRPFFNSGKIAVLKFKAPDFPDTRGGDDFSREDQVRYWSVCIGDWRLTTSSQCIADEAAKLDEDGYVNIVVGPDMLAPACSKWNNIRWGLHANPILIFRQISPHEDFDNSFEKAHIAFDENSGEIDLRDIFYNEPDKIASTIIHDFAPSGRYCTIGEFFINHCGF
jgi:hypothetical protein